ncbi:MAG: CoA transferase [Ahrensia sp.]|nr:CoA transferase [Ahrensia sp.]|tara:strand:- start:8144 stop:9241 length:1098 start_codon:yes stop_codon:yes gene_type:complete
MLDGIRIIEFEGLGPGPFAAMLFADLGADVITIHRSDPPAGPLPATPGLLDRGKRSIALDLKAPGDRDTALSLIASADGLIEGFRPGVMERLGLGPDPCHAANPALVYGRMTGWGQEGPLAQIAGHDLNYIARSGALWYASAPGDAPMTPPTVVGDIGGGALYLAIGMLAALHKAKATGCGTVVDAAIVDGSAHMMNLFMALGDTGLFSMQRGRSLLDGPHWSRTYRTSDGGFMSVQCLEPKFYAQFLDRIGLARDPDFGRQFDRELWPALGERLETLFASASRAHWTELFRGTDCCVSPVLDPLEAARDPHMASRRTWRDRDGHLQAAPAPRFAGAPAWEPPPSPKRGEHTDEILAELATKADG